MPPENDANTTTDPSSEVESQDVTTTDPSAVEQDEPTSLTDVLEATLEAGEEGVEEEVSGDPSTPPDGAVEEDPEAEGKPKAEGEEGDEENFDDLPFHKHPRFQKLISERNELRDEREAWETEKTELGDKASRYEAVNGFLTESNISGEEFGQLLEMGSLLKNDPAQFMEKIQPYLQQAGVFTGDVLPDDIMQDIQNGYMSEERGRELAALRAKGSFQQNKIEQTNQSLNDQERQRTFETMMQNNQTAVSSWEQQWKRTDPDYDKKQPLVLQAYGSLCQQKPPQTPEDAVKLAQEAREGVEAHLRTLLPKKPPVEPVTESGRGSASTPEPKNVRDIVDQFTSG